MAVESPDYSMLRHILMSAIVNLSFQVRFQRINSLVNKSVAEKRANGDCLILLPIPASKGRWLPAHLKSAISASICHDFDPVDP